MSKASKIPRILERVYNLTLGIDYDQPASLAADLDVLADEIIAANFVSKNFKAASKDGYLGEVLEAIKAPTGRLQTAIEASREIEGILGRMDYGSLHDGDAKELERWLEVLVGELEEYFNEA